MGDGFFVPKKSTWEARQDRQFRFYCPKCKIKRVVPARTDPWSFKNIFRVILATAVFTMVLWPIFGVKGFVAFLPIWAFFEFYHRYRLRKVLACYNCGFDPYLFLRDHRAARDRMDQFWRKQFADKGIPYPEDDNASNETVSEQEQEGEPLDPEIASEIESATSPPRDATSN